MRKGNSEVGDISGKWSRVMEFTAKKVSSFACRDRGGTNIYLQSGNKRVIFDTVKDGQNVAPKFVPEEDKQEPNESRR